MIPGIELSGERRLLTLWLIFSLVFGSAYYLGLSTREPFVQRFERAYYAVFWSRPFLSTGIGGLDVGIITPTYVSSLIDTEMWIWVRNNATPAPTATPPYEPDADEGRASGTNVNAVNEAVVSPLIVIKYTSDIERVPKVTPTAEGSSTEASTTGTAVTIAPTPTPINPYPIEAQMLLREGAGSIDLHTQSSSTVAFPNIFPGETAARLVWVRLMPQAYQKATGDISKAIYIAEDELEGSVMFEYFLWENPGEYINKLDIEGEDPPQATINTRKAVMRGFARTLLLPPWSNGLLLGLALIAAFMVNMTTHFFDQKLADDHQGLREQAFHQALAERKYTPPDKGRDSWSWRFLFSLFQGAFWALAIVAVFLLIARLTEMLVLCELLEDAMLEDTSLTSINCVQWPLYPWFYFVLILAGGYFYLGYLCNEYPPSEAKRTIKAWLDHALGNSPQPTGTEPPQPPGTESPQPTGTESPQPPGTNATQNTGQDEQPEPDANRQAASQARKLTKQVNELYRDIKTLRQTAPLDVTEDAIRQFRVRQGGLESEAEALPPAVWHSRKTAAKNLLALEKILDQLESYAGLAERAKELILQAKRGEDGAIERLHNLQKELVDSGRPFDTEPSLTLSRVLADELVRTDKYHTEHFADFPKGVPSERTLISALKAIEGFQRQEGNNAYVRFFKNHVDVKDTECASILLFDALEIGRKRLTRYRTQKYQEKRGRFERLQKRPMADKQNEKAKNSLQKLLNEIEGWPESLPGWAEFPELPNAAANEEPPFGAQIDGLRAEIEAEVRRREGEPGA